MTDPDLTLMDWAIDFVTAKQPKLCLMAGRGAGKTHAIQARIAWMCSRYPGFRYMYIAPLNGQAFKVYFEMVANPVLKPFIKNKQSRPWPVIYWKNGSQAEFRSFQRPDNVRAPGAHEVCIDESQDGVFQETDVDMAVMPLLGRWQSPAQIDGYPRSVIIFSGQFRGDDWRKQRYWDPGQPELDGSPNPKYSPKMFRSWRVPSSAGWSYNTPGGKEELAMVRTYCTPEVWDQEWDCIPRANQNAAFPIAEIEACSIKRKQPLQMWPLEKPWTGEGTCAGVDIAEIQDYTAIVVMNQRFQVIYFEKFPKQKHGISAQRAAQICAHFNAVEIVDATGGAKGGRVGDQTEYVQLYRNHAHARRLNFRTFFFQGLNKNRIVGGFGLALQQEQIGIPEKNCEILLAELKQYEYIYKPKDKIYVYGHPPGLHDDCVAAALMAWEGVSNGWYKADNTGSIGHLLG